MSLFGFSGKFLLISIPVFKKKNMNIVQNYCTLKGIGLLYFVYLFFVAVSSVDMKSFVDLTLNPTSESGCSLSGLICMASG